MRQVSNKHIVIFLDYDGTLSPIVDDPDRAFMSNEICSVVSNVAKYFKTTIINGKSRDNVYELVDLPELYYDGNRSMNIISPVKNTLTTNDANCVNEVSRKIKVVDTRDNWSVDRDNFFAWEDEKYLKITNLNEAQATKGVPVLPDDHADVVDQHLKHIKNKSGEDDSDEEKDK
ncbi:probable trehalose-phosphate phosphatase G [Capsicum annuum]|uniref:probable trehalose-phosphate phosphatase G n=1 Tax=Capsicum annuum TaxID=4072 RepID=UPI001FB16B89|nr:probable trehalose-phosphate phosphatase G [Capsicum annuum]